MNARTGRPDIPSARRARRIAAAVLIAVSMAAATATAAELSPDETVRHYLTALKAGDFAVAYPLITREMAQHRSRDEWTNEQQWATQMTEVKIASFEVYPSTIQGERAYVPILLRAADAVRGAARVDERELYTLVREDGRWKITAQRIVEPDELAKWFPVTPVGTPE